MSATPATRRVAVLMGGWSHERAISIQSGTVIFSHLAPARYLCRAVDLTMDRRARMLAPGCVPNEAAWRRARPQGLLDAFRALQRWGVEVVIVALHGAGGEDGVVQGFLEMLRLPFTHSGVRGSALAMDKEISKRLYASHGIPTPEYLIIDRARPRAAQLRAVRLGWPVVAKPPCLGSSFEVHIVPDAPSLRRVVQRLLALDDRVLLERHVRGREFTCAVLQRTPQAAPAALPVTEIVPVASPFFDFQAKYTAGATREITPAKISARMARELQRQAVACHRALHCGCVSRTDFMTDARGRAFALETNTIPGMTATSLLPQAAAAVGISFAALLDIMINYALLQGGSTQ
ncbi:MAG: D-alanine--D-alanine ligase [bacterium]|nr:D-alanine--D-alanine ligase [bacterium]